MIRHAGTWLRWQLVHKESKVPFKVWKYELCVWSGQLQSWNPKAGPNACRWSPLPAWAFGDQRLSSLRVHWAYIRHLQSQRSLMRLWHMDNLQVRIQRNLLCWFPSDKKSTIPNNCTVSEGMGHWWKCMTGCLLWWNVRTGHLWQLNYVTIVYCSDKNISL